MLKIKRRRSGQLFSLVEHVEQQKTEMFSVPGGERRKLVCDSRLQYS